MHVLVLGGYGLIGLPALSRLVEAGHTVTAVGRSVRQARISFPEADWIERDIAKLKTVSDWLPMLAGVQAVVNCSGALQDSARDNLQALQSDAMKALFEACRFAGIERVVQVSAAGVSPDAATAFFRTKAEADAALMASDLSWTILRPGLVIAPAAYGGTALLRGLASFPVVIPLLGGEQTIQTVSVDDVADAIVASVEGRMTPQRVYDLVEEKPHRLRDIVLAFAAWLGRKQVPIVKVPASLGRAMAGVGDVLSSLGWRPPLRTTAVQQLDAGVTGDPSAWIEERGSAPAGLRQTLRRYPATVQERWFGRMWLLKPVVIASLCLFWMVSGIIGFWERGAAAAILTTQGISTTGAMIAVIGGSLLDIALGILILVRATHRIAALGMIATTFAYLTAGSFLTPHLWLDPLGPFVKTIPAAILALVALAIADER